MEDLNDYDIKTVYKNYESENFIEGQFVVLNDNINRNNARTVIFELLKKYEKNQFVFINNFEYNLKEKMKWGRTSYSFSVSYIKKEN